MIRLLLLTAGVAAAFQLAKKYNVTFDSVKKYVSPLLAKYVKL